jgi:hypothetical protein
MAKARSPHDRELEAMGSILSALNGLEGESIQRVLDYVFSRLSIAAPSRVKAFTTLPMGPASQPVDVGPKAHRSSIRDLKEEKQPESSNQMAALVAFYLSEVADVDERKDVINTSDLEKYFKQAGFKLPKALPQTLQNAAAAGYLDAAGNGLFKLNPVGYNLVVHGLPRSQKSADAFRKRRKTPARGRSRRS